MSLHPEVVRFIPQMLARMQRRTGRQVLVSTHSPEMISDEGVGLDEVLILQPGREGTSVRVANSFKEIRALLEYGVPMSDAVIPYTKPKNAEQLPLFSEK